jgi:haloalkane dehalogenase
VSIAAVESVEVNGLRLGYRELGSGPAVLLLHGWPSSSHLYREVMVPVARTNRALALDLPGFGASDKPLDVHYDFEFFAGALDGFLDALGVDVVALALHDMGGPIGVRWALDRPGRATGIALLNTLLYPDFSPFIAEFVKALGTPEGREYWTGAAGLQATVRLGLADPSNATAELVTAFTEPFATAASRLALAKAGTGLPLRGYADIAARLKTMTIPVRMVYGVHDRILPDIARTVARVQRDIPHAEVIALGNCGHFLQEEAGERVGELLAEFFAATTARSTPAPGRRATRVRTAARSRGPESRGPWSRTG